MGNILKAIRKSKSKPLIDMKTSLPISQPLPAVVLNSPPEVKTLPKALPQVVLPKPLLPKELESGTFLYIPEDIERHMKCYHKEKIPPYIAEMIIKIIKEDKSPHPSYTKIETMNASAFTVCSLKLQIELTDATRAAIQGELQDFAVKKQQTYHHKSIIQSFAAIKAIYYFYNFGNISKYDAPISPEVLKIDTIEMDLPRNTVPLMYYHLNREVMGCLNVHFYQNLMTNSPKIIAEEIVKILDVETDENDPFSFYSIEENLAYLKQDYVVTEGEEDDSNGYFNAVRDNWNIITKSNLTKEQLINEKIIPALQLEIPSYWIDQVKWHCVHSPSDFYYQTEEARQLMIGVLRSLLHCEYSVVKHLASHKYFSLNNEIVPSLNLSFDGARYRMFQPRKAKESKLTVVDSAANSQDAMASLSSTPSKVKL